MQQWAEDMQFRLAADRLGLFRITSLVYPANVRIVHDHNGSTPLDGRQELFLALAVGISQLSDVEDLPVGLFESLCHPFKVVISTDDLGARELLPCVSGLARTSATNKEDHSRSHDFL